MTKRTQAEIAKAHAKAMDDLTAAASSPKVPTARTAEKQLALLGPEKYFKSWVPRDYAIMIPFLKKQRSNA